MASSRRAGTNENIAYYGSGQAYDEGDMTVWEQATDNDLVSSTTTEVLEVESEGGGGALWDESPDTFADATTSSSYMRIIRARSGHLHSGIPVDDGSCAGFDIAGGTDYKSWRIDENNFKVQDLALKSNTDYAGEATVIDFRGADCEAVGAMVYDSANVSDDLVAFRARSTGNSNFYINCLAHNLDDFAFKVYDGTGNFYNCTENGCGGSVRIDAGETANTKNCVLDDTINNAGTHNQTTDTSDTPTYVDSANDDFHLDSADVTAKDNGTDLSADGSFAFDDDIDGDIRSGDWDIGFDEISGGATQTLTVAGSSHSHLGAAAFLSGLIGLSPNETSHSFGSDVAALTYLAQLAVAGGTHAHTAGTVVLELIKILVAAGCTHAHQAAGSILTYVAQLSVDEGLHGNTGAGVTLDGTLQLSPAEASHALSSDQAALTMTGALTVAEALHAHTVDQIIVDTVVNLVLASGVHAHSADSVATTIVAFLVVNGSLHSQSAGTLSLTQLHQLALNEALHSHGADQVQVVCVRTITIDDTVHSLTSEQVVLTITGSETHLLVVQGSLHAHTVKQIILQENWKRVIIEGKDASTGRTVRILGYMRQIT